ncbi:MAG TPA: hypothetical protein DEB39_11995 [Planctomycetaceae bacterium]|nr:hypothetical protein [Planctomycetaceae bacterium]
MGQSEAGRMLQEAMEAVRPATDRLDEMYAQIDAEAAAARARGENIPEEAIEKARAMAKEKIMGKAETKDGKPHDNPALVRGSVAYVDFLRRGAGNDHMKKIRENTARQNELLAQNVETTKTVASVLNQKIEIVN